MRRLTVLGAGRWHAPLGRPSASQVLAVCGPRGVGKSTVAANLAIAFAGLRSRVVLVDLDLRRPIQHRIFGVTSPVAGLHALLEGDVDTVEQALTPTTVRNLFLVTADGLQPPARPGPAQQQHLLQQIWELDADVVIADVASPDDTPTFDLFGQGALRIVVSPPDARAIGAAYDFLRAQVIGEIEQVAREPDGAAPQVADLWATIVAKMRGPSAPPMQEVLGLLQARPDLQIRVAQRLGGLGGWLIGNRARSSDEADLLHAASRLFADYLGIATPVLGIIGASDHMAARSTSGRPLLLGAGIDRNVRLFHSMAEHLLMGPTERVAPLPAAGFSAPKRRASQPAGPPPEHDGGQGSDLPASLGSYMRRFPRHPVDWHARYVSRRGRDVDVRVFEISEGGASIEAIPGFDLGLGGRLTFTQIEGQPTLNVTVMDARRPMGRAGVRFDDGAELAARLAAIARSVAEPSVEGRTVLVP